MCYAFFSGLIFVYTHFACAAPCPDSIVGYAYMKERYIKKLSFFKFQFEMMINSLLSRMFSQRFSLFMIFSLIPFCKVGKERLCYFKPRLAQHSQYKRNRKIYCNGNNPILPFLHRPTEIMRTYTSLSISAQSSFS